MRKFPLVLAVAYGTVCATGVAQKTTLYPEMIVPGDSAAVTAQRVSGAGLCRAHFDRDGRVADVTMVRSTGSAALDEDAMRSARRNWQGLPETTVSVPVKYAAAPLKKGLTIHYDTPIPQYPAWAGRQRFSGTCLLQVLFDAQGKAIFAMVAKSSGSPALDTFTVRHALSHWKSSGGEESILTYPVAYLYREQQAPNKSPQSFSSVPGVQLSPGSNGYF